MAMGLIRIESPRRPLSARIAVPFLARQEAANDSKVRQNCSSVSAIPSLVASERSTVLYWEAPAAEKASANTRLPLLIAARWPQTSVVVLPEPATASISRL